MAARVLQLLGDEQRWRIVQELARSDRKVSELTASIGKPQNLVSYHLANLRDAGIVSSRRSAADGRDTYYRLDLRRCGEMLSEAGAAIQPSLRLEPRIDTTPRSRRKPSVLFLCTGNSSRSQMAEALIEHRSHGAIRAKSAGSHPKPLHATAIRVMAERGVDISSQRSKHLDRFRDDSFDRVVTLCDKVREICPEFPGATSSIHWSMSDPAAEMNDDGFVRTADELEERIPFLIGELLLSAGKEKTA